MSGFFEELPPWQYRHAKTAASAAGDRPASLEDALDTIAPRHRLGKGLPAGLKEGPPWVVPSTTDNSAMINWVLRKSLEVQMGTISPSNFLEVCILNCACLSVSGFLQVYLRQVLSCIAPARVLLDLQSPFQEFRCRVGPHSWCPCQPRRPNQWYGPCLD